MDGVVLFRFSLRSLMDFLRWGKAYGKPEEGHCGAEYHNEEGDAGYGRHNTLDALVGAEDVELTDG